MIHHDFDTRTTPFKIHNMLLAQVDMYESMGSAVVFVTVIDVGTSGKGKMKKNYWGVVAATTVCLDDLAQICLSGTKWEKLPDAGYRQSWKFMITDS
jgi:hypothetical protein